MTNKCLTRFWRFILLQPRQAQLHKIKVMMKIQHSHSPIQNWSLLSVCSLHTSAENRNRELRTEEIQEEKTEMPASEYLQKLNPEMQRKLAIIKLEYDVLDHGGTSVVPDEVTDEMWVQLLECLTTSSRRKLYKYFTKVEKHKKAKKRKQEEKRKRKEEREVEVLEGKREASKRFENTIFIRISNTYMKPFYRHQLSHAMIFGTPLIIDLDYEDHMRRMEMANVVKQLMMSYGANKLSKDPFHFIFCNAFPDGEIMKTFKHQLKESSLENFLVTVTEKSYLDLYPKEKLVYLSPHAPEMLDSFNFDDVYIVGGFVDKGPMKPVSLAKSKEQKIRCAKLPLDRFLSWSQGNKSLTIDQVTRILTELKDTGDWEKALKFVPRRKVVQDEDFE
ncbi:hypothetical protein ScPMuIL_009249 [Solemya velum]